jgi:hypothetical protein
MIHGDLLVYGISILKEILTIGQKAQFGLHVPKVSFELGNVQ